MPLKILLSSSRSGAENYENALRALGAEPTTRYCPKADTGYDGLLLCGGGDVDPARFGQENMGSRDIDPDRDRAELDLIEAYTKAGKPILGICRGHQIVNIALGGTLIQDLPEDLLPFHRWEEADKVHPVRAKQGSIFHTLYGPLFPVNSAHHQAVDRLGEELEPLLWSEGGIVEGMIHKSLPILCVQFHPERMCCEKSRPDTVDGRPIFERFLQMCEE